MKKVIMMVCCLLIMVMTISANAETLTETTLIESELYDFINTIPVGEYLVINGTFYGNLVNGTIDEKYYHKGMSVEEGEQNIENCMTLENVEMKCKIINIAGKQYNGNDLIIVEIKCNKDFNELSEINPWYTDEPYYTVVMLAQVL